MKLFNVRPCFHDKKPAKYDKKAAKKIKDFKGY